MRYFLDWKTDFSHAAAAWCAEHLGSGSEGVFIAVPTQQAGRRLRDALAEACGEGFIGWSIITPMSLPALFTAPAPAPTPSAILSAWRETLRGAPREVLTPLFAGREWLKDDAACFRMADRLQRLRAELAEGAYSLNEIAARGLVEEEPERWQALAELESLYLGRLEADGLTDPVSLQLRAFNDPQPSPEIRRLIFAGVPDPVPALCRFADCVPTDILIQAPTELADAFDPYGRPIPEPICRRWSHATDLGLPDSAITLAQDPDAQATLTAGFIAQAQLPPEKIGLGVLDSAIAPALTATFDLAGIAVFDPAPRPLSRRPLSRLVLLLARLADDSGRETLAALLRHPDVLTFFGGDAVALIGELDHLFAERLCSDLDSLLAFARDPLRAALTQIAAWQSALRADLIPALRETLRTIHSTTRIDTGTDPDAEAEVDGINTIFQELEGSPLTSKALAELLRIRLESLTATPSREAELLAYEGLLELAWSSAPLLILCGFNDGIIPDSIFSDTFLPNELRKRLSNRRGKDSPAGVEWFRHDATRYARDTYLLSALIAARPNQNNREGVKIILGRTNDRGDVLRPSRLLFHTPAEALPARAALLFRELATVIPAFPAESHLPLDPFDPDLPRKPWRCIGGLPSLSPSALKDWLHCPFRFYLKRRLGFTPQNTDKNAPDALDFGTLIHEALHPLGDPKNALSSSTDFEALSRALARKVDAAIRSRYGSDIPLSVEAIRATLKARIDAFLPHHIALREAGWKTLAAEWEGFITLDGFHLYGRIDRIDRNTHTGTWRVYDYKTFDTPATPAEKHTETRRDNPFPFLAVEIISGKGKTLHRTWADFQLPLYREFLRAGFPECAPSDSIELAYALLPETAGSAGVAVWERYSDELHAAAIAALRGTLACLARDSRPDYWPPRTIRAEDDEFSHIIQSFTGTLL